MQVVVGLVIGRCCLHMVNSRGVVIDDGAEDFPDG